MGNSLQEELLKAGLVTKQKTKQARSQKKKRRQDVAAETDEQRRRLREEAEEKARQDREFNRKRDEEARKRAEENELRQLIHQNRVARRHGDVVYNFQDGTALKRLYMTPEQHQQVVVGELAIVRQDNLHELVPAAVAARVAERRADLVLVSNRPEDSKTAADEDDPYADYQVPDDLMW